MPPSNLLLASKVVILEEPPSIRNIPGVETAISAFLGVTERGPIRIPQFFTSFEEYKETMGGRTIDSDLPLAIEGAFLNQATAVWVSRTCHYTDNTDPLSFTATKGTQTIPDRGGVAGPAILDSVAGPFALEPGQQLDVNLDAAGTDSLVFSAAPASALSGNAETFALVDSDTLVYRTNATKQTTALDQITRTITFLTADFAAIGAATAEEVAAVINRDGVGISAEATGGGTTVTIRSDARGSGASLLIDASSTSISAGKLNIASGTTTGTGNVSLIDAVTATEIAALLTGLPLSSGTATVTGGDKVRLTSTGTGSGVDVEIEVTTTALGIFAGVLPITQAGSDAAESPSILVEARTEGEWITTPSLYAISIEPPTSGDADRFNFRVLRAGVVQETIPNVSMDPLDARYVEDVVEAESGLVSVVDQFSPAVSPSNLPKLGEFSAWAGQDNGLAGLVDADFIGSDAGKTGLFAFDQVDNITLLAVPGRTSSAVHNAMLDYCEGTRVGSCFATLDPPPGLDEQEIKTYVETTAGIAEKSEFGGIVWPNVKIANPQTSIYGADPEIVVPPSGHIHGLFARQDASAPGGIYTAAANVENGVLFGVIGFETDDVLDERKRDVVYPVRINPITQIRRGPRHVDGSRTLKGTGNFPSIPERRGVIFIEQSIKQGLLFAKHRNNDRRLRMEIKNTITAFLLEQFNNGAFRGRTPKESFFVDVSDALNTPEVQLTNKVLVRIGLATQKPADFVVVLVTQDTREIEARIAAETG